MRKLLKPFADTKNYIWAFFDLAFCSRKTDLPQSELLLVSMVNYEDDYLPHWLKYHFSIGFDHALLYLNENDDICVCRVEDVLEKAGVRDRVSLIYWPDPKHFKFLLRNQTRNYRSRLLPEMQSLAFRHFKKYYGDRCTYYAKLDPDEYLFLRQGHQEHQGASHFQRQWLYHGL